MIAAHVSRVLIMIDLGGLRNTSGLVVKLPTSLIHCWQRDTFWGDTKYLAAMWYRDLTKHAA